MAVLTNGQGEGQISVQVNEQGAFGASPTLAVNLPNRPAQNDVDDAIFNPQGPRVPFGTTYESGLAIRIVAPGASREFITAGTIGGTGNNVNGFFLDPSPSTPQNNLERNSRFFWPNNVVRPSNPGDIPPGARLRFDLQQTLVDLQHMGSQDGTALVQEYTIQNVSGGTLSFELIRYWDGDIFNGGSGNTPLLDGGGERVFDVRRGVNGVFQTDVANNDPTNDATFIEIQSSVDNVPRTARWEVGTAGRALPLKPPGDLLTRIVTGQPLRDDVIPAATDGDANDVRDVGQDDDVAVALRQEFLNVPNNGFVIFTSTTVFGHPPRGTVVPPPPQFGRVEGTKYLDRNSSGTRDPGEPGVPNFVIYADLNQNGVRENSEPSAITDQNGAYSLQVPLGTFDIREEPQPNWTQTGPLTGFYTVTLAMVGQILLGQDFGNVPEPGEIRGVKFNDDNRSGAQEANEPGMPGVTIYLDLDDDGVLDASEPQTVTDAQGNYAFTGLEPGIYVVREIVPNGFEQTTPGGDGAHRVGVLPAAVVTGVDFGNRLMRGSIRGLKWNDLDGDGQRDATEPGVSGAVIYIDSNRDGRFNLGEKAAITNAVGNYEITDVLPGEYIVRELVPTGTQVTFPATGFHQILVYPGLPSFANFGNRANFDFGDAPDSYGTLLATNGARHGIVPGFHLGPTIDGEPDGQPTPNATGDDLAGGGFGAPVNFRVGDQPQDFILTDVTGDGIPDLVTADSGSNQVSVAAGFSDGTFGPPLRFDVEDTPAGVFAADFNGDGETDLVVSHSNSNDVVVLLNDGAGGFLEALDFPAGGPQSDVVALDADEDGAVDIVVARPGTNNVVVLRNTNEATLDFEAAVVITPPQIPAQLGPVSLELGRLDGDSLLDLVVVNRGSNSISVLRNVPGGLFAAPTNYTVGAGANDVVIADLNGDGFRDLAVANEIAQTVTVLLNNGGGVFPTRRTFDVPGGPVAITAGLFDGQPGVDLAVALRATDSVAVLSNDGAGSFPAATVFPTGDAPVAIASALLDLDTVFDILTLNFDSGAVSVLNFTGGDEDGVRFSGPFVPGRVTGVTVNASSPGFLSAWFDFDRNGVFTPADRVFQDVALVAGDNPLVVQTPAGVTDGPVFARFRFSAQQGLGPTGAAASGEVEDYQVLVQTGVGIPNTGHTNLANPEDVDANGRVELFDVLLLVNDLRANGIRMLPPVVNPPPPPPFVDVNGNGLVDLNDVLRVIQRILADQGAPLAGQPEAEGEPDPFESTLDDIAADVSLAWMES